MSTSVSDPVIGHELDGRYRVVSRLAQGGMGTVYQALDTRLDRVVAVKVMHPSLVDDDDSVRRFIREAKSAARLSHPNVVGVYDQGQDGGRVFLAMEYVAGRTLRDLLQTRGRLDPHEALTIMEGVLAALGAAHRAGLVHRDVKPENVLLADDGRVKVADFGLARAFAASNHTKTSGLLLGTAGYLAPEQVQYGTADPRSDVYAAGIMAFELLTGTQPFGGETPLAVAYKHVSEPVPAPSSIVAGLPPVLDGLVGRATEREPARRPADADELLVATLQVRQALPAMTGPTRAPEPPGGEYATEVIRRGARDTLLVPRPSAPPTAIPPTSPSRGSIFHRWGVRGIVLASVLALVVLLGVGGAGLVLMRTEVPTGLDGTTVSAATAKAGRLGFEVQVAPARFSEKVPRDHVITTEPRARESIRRGGTITLIPSKGPRVVEVPDLRGSSLDEATKTLRSVGLRRGEVSHEFSVTVPKGEVIGTDPAAGDKARHDTAVDLVVSSGIEVPDLRGKLLQQAEDELRKRGLDIDITLGFSMTYPEGQVMRQHPAGGGLRAGSTVELVVSKGPPTVAVPDVVGQKVNKAKKTLVEAGFEVRVRRFFGNRVRMQRPGGGTSAPKGTTVTLVAF